ncbi:MAG TPA: hypothetical protein VFI79_18335, partial [Gemmatimonadales bacterium]|nr:hypothetical protein [Gemmatimonadales bacterium]
IALILQGEPDWSRLPAKTPERLKALLGRCLEKDSKRRLRDMGDARIELEEVQSASSASRSGAVRVGLTNGHPGTTGAAPRSPARQLAMAAGLLAFGVAMGFAIERIAWPPPPAPAVRFGIAAPPHMLLDPDPNNLAISPDGGMLAMVVADSSGNTSLWVRALGSFEARPLPGTRGAAFPFWSPDSRQIAYFADNTLYRVAAAGGTPQTVCDAPNPRGGAWGPRGVMLLSFATGPLMQVHAAGGTPTPATAMAKGETSHRGPCFLPDGEHFIYVTLPPAEGSLYPCVRGALHELKREPPFGSALSAPVYAAPGHVIFNGRGALVAQRFDAGRGRLIGDPFPIGAPSQPTTFSATPALSVSRTGVLAWAAAGHELRRVVWLDRQGRRIGAVDAPLGNWRYGTISNDGTRAALVMENAGRLQLWVIDFARGISQRLDEQPGEMGIPAWSPDDRNLAYDIETGGLADILVRPSDGSSPARHVPTPPVQFRAVQSWSADGKLLLCQEIGASRNWDLVILPVSGGPVRPYVVTRFSESNADISPDGRWVVYDSDESGATHEYLQSFPDPGARQQVSRDTVQVGGWISGGREIALYRQDGGIESVPVTPGPTPGLGTPRLLFRQPEDVSFLYPTRDGRRFMAFVAAEKVTPTISVAVDWRATATP